MTAPCTWPVDRDCLPAADFRDHPSTLSGAVETAVGVLWALTGRRYGLCTVVARPCTTSAGVAVAWSGPWMVPILDSGVWRNQSCGTVRCERGRSSVLLPGPVHDITGVAVDGARLDPSGWAQEGDWLLRTGAGEWPTQNIDRPLGEPGTWSVTYRRGLAPPPGAGRCVAVLAGEFYQACTSPDKCVLPRGTRTVTRQGVTVEMVDPQAVISAGGTGLPEVDMWIHAHNPHHVSAPSEVWSPDMQAVW